MAPQNLNPPPSELGLHSPALGPWFSTDRLRLGAPVADLAVPLSWAAGAEGGAGAEGAEAWFLPPAGGVFTLRRVGARNPGPLAELRLPHGGPAFPPGGGGHPPDRIVAIHRLLPEVEVRLASLFRRLPPAGGVTLPDGTAAHPRRAVPRWFVLDFRTGPLSEATQHQALLNRLPDGFFPSTLGTDAPDSPEGLRVRLEHLGFRPPSDASLTGNSGAAPNGPRPMQRLEQPAPAGTDGAARDATRLFRVREAGAAAGTLPWLRVFDSRGWPLDPGAVAAWFAWLVRGGAGGLSNLHVESDAENRITARGADGSGGLTVQLVAPGGGAPPARVLERVRVVGADAVPDQPAATRVLFRRPPPDPPAAGEPDPDPGQVAVSFEAPPEPAADDAAAPLAPEHQDPAPEPRVGLLPLGRLTESVNLAGIPRGNGWVGGSAEAPALTRDHVQLQVASMELLLVGQSRRPPPGLGPEVPTDDPRRRAARDQARRSTRTRVGTFVREGALLLAHDEGATALLAALGGPAAAGGGADPDPDPSPAGGDGPPPRAHLVAPSLDRRWGPVPDPATELPDVDPPETPLAHDQWSLHPLRGGGEASDGVYRGQRVLFRVAPGWAPPGRWVRVWGQQMNPRAGIRLRTDGGGGRADDAGAVYLVLALADGAESASAPLGFELMVVTARGQRTFSDLRKPRPIPVGGDPVALDAAVGPLVICEAGVHHPASSLPLPDGSVPSGSTLVALGTADPPAGGVTDPSEAPTEAVDPDEAARLVDASGLPLAAARTPSLEGRLGADQRIRLTLPAFGASPVGDLPGEEGTPAPGGVTLRVHRRMLPDSLMAGAPTATMDRLAVAAIRRGPLVAPPLPGGSDDPPHDPGAGVSLDGVIMGGPALAAFHERLPHRAAHPLCPAGPEIHGTGVRLRGPAAVGLWEVLAERTSEHTLALVAEAFHHPTPTPAEPEGDRLWGAVLRTVAAGVETEVGLDLLLGSLYPYEASWNDLRGWLIDRLSAVGGLPGLPDPEALLDSLAAAGSMEEPVLRRIQRALDRRMRGALQGYREGATALLDAVGRAEELIYLETPALCELAFGPGGQSRGLVEVLTKRMDARPALRLVLCLPQRAGPGLPRPLERVRNDLLRRVLTQLRGTEGAIQPAAGGEGGGEGGGTGVPGWGRPRGDRIAVFTPGAGPGRALRFVTTSVVVDDAWAMVGTTHLWRRGLTFDGSLAVSLTDERLQGGKPDEVARLRQGLLAHRLGVAESDLPLDPGGIVAAIRTLVERGGGDRLLPTLPSAPDREPAAREAGPDAAPEAGGGEAGAESSPSLQGREHDLWNPEGSPERMINVATWLSALMLPQHVAELSGPLPPLPTPNP